MLAPLLDGIIEDPLQPLDSTIHRLLQSLSTMSHRDRLEARQAGFQHAVHALVVGLMAVLLAEMDFHSGEPGAESAQGCLHETHDVARQPLTALNVLISVHVHSHR